MGGCGLMYYNNKMYHIFRTQKFMPHYTRRLHLVRRSCYNKNRIYKWKTTYIISSKKIFYCFYVNMHGIYVIKYMYHLIFFRYEKKFNNYCDR